MRKPFARLLLPLLVCFFLFPAVSAQTSRAVQLPSRVIKAIYYEAYARLEIKIVSGPDWPWTGTSDPKRSYPIAGHSIISAEDSRQPPDLVQYFARTLDDLCFIQIGQDGWVILTFNSKTNDPQKLRGKVAKMLSPRRDKTDVAVEWSTCLGPNCGF